VIVIHEIFGLSDWARCVTDELAEAGYIAIAPDLLSGARRAAGHGGVDQERRGSGQAIRKLPADQITGPECRGVYVVKLPSCNGKLAVAGFCWGGAQSFRFATNNKELKAAFGVLRQWPGKGGGRGTHRVSRLRLLCRERQPCERHPSDRHRTDEKAGKTFEPKTYTAAATVHARRRSARRQCSEQEGTDEAWDARERVVEEALIRA